MKELFVLVGFAEIVLVIFMQWQYYLKKIIVTFAISSLLIGLLLFVQGGLQNNTSLIVLAALTLLVRFFFIPYYMLSHLEKVYKEKNPKQVVSTGTSIVVSLLLVILAYVIYRLTLYRYISVEAGSIPIAIILQGIFLVISRNNAFVQLIGYMIMENSLFFMAGYMFPDLPFIVEAGILLDLLGLVMISGVVMKLREDSVSEVVDEFDEFRG